MNGEKKTIRLFESHQYYTAYCKEHLNKTKMANLRKLKKKNREIITSVNPITTLLESQASVEKSERSKKSESDSPDRTIETMFRTTSSNSQRLSNQADAKAHILISVNSIVISVLLSLLVRRLDEYSSLTIPVIMFLIVNLVTITFSILATRPNIPKGIVSQKRLKPE